MAELSNPHDKLFRALLCDPERARDFLRDHLPNAVSGRLAPDLPEILDGSFVDEALSGSQSDLLMKLRLASGGEAFAYVLVEHKSTPDPMLPLQLASYMVRIWKRHAGTGRGGLPPIIPVVVYHGADRWAVAESLLEMIAPEARDLAYLPGSGYTLRNLGTLDRDALSRNPALWAGFVTLRREALSFLSQIADSLAEGSDLRRQVLEYVLRVYNVDLETLRDVLRREGQTELEAQMGTIAEALLEQGKAVGFADGETSGIAKGMAEGMTKGMNLGKAEGMATTLRRLLARRFGPLPPEIDARIARAGTEEVEGWLDAVLEAPDLVAVFENTPPH